jgi:predicted kinase
MQSKILIMGLPGAGKTALASALAPLLNAVVFNADAVRANLSRAAWAGCAIALSKPAAP